MSKLIRLHNFGGKEVLRTEELDISQPDAGEVRVSVRAASVNPVDFKIRSGKYPTVKNDRLPCTLGRDISGTIEKCGAQATRFKVGDEVFGMMDIHGGGYAQQAIVDQDAIAAKPPGLDHVHATAIPLAGLTAWQGLFKHGKVKPHVQKTFPLSSAADALASVEQGHSVGKVVLKENRRWDLLDTRSCEWESKGLYDTKEL
jgi:NADPH:quinone reductase-like Zn-dependent oxidoreductase